MKIWSIAHKQLGSPPPGLGLGFIVIFLLLSSFMSCSGGEKKVEATTIPHTVERVVVEPGEWYKFDKEGVWYKAEKVRYLNVIDSTISLPKDTIKVKLKSGHLEPYNLQLVIVQGDTSG